MTFVTSPEVERLLWVCATAKIVSLVAGAFILYYMHTNTARARKGDHKAMRSIILPAYQRLVCVPAHTRGALSPPVVWEYQNATDTLFS